MSRRTSDLRTVPEPARPPAPHADDWPSRGACREADPDLFFHPYAEREPSRGDRDRAAVAVCDRCPVLLRCRVAAREAREPYGVWGGETETERDAWLRAQDARGDSLPA